MMPLMMQARQIILSVAVIGLLLLALPIEGQKAQAYPVPETLSRVVGAPTATCTPRGCRYKVTCEGGPGLPLQFCAFNLSLVHTKSSVGYLTRVPTCIYDPEVPCLPKAELVILPFGETTTLNLKLLKVGRQVIKRLLEKGKRTTQGIWEAFRADIDPALGLGPENEAEAVQWSLVPGFFNQPVLGGWLVFQRDVSTKIKLNR